MSRRHRTIAARLRGVAAGLLTAALAFVAHALGSGDMPSGAGVTLLAVLAATVGAVAAVSDRASDPRRLLALLATGQLVGHLALALVDNHHASGGTTPQVPMIAAHVAAVVVGAALIASCERLCRMVCTAMRGFGRHLPGRLASSTATPVVGGDQPLRAALLLAASVSRRGPPVSVAPLT